jgi:hypothetical protein
VSLATIAATVDLSMQTRSPSVRWSIPGAERNTFKITNCEEVTALLTSPAQAIVSTCCARRIRCPGKDSWAARSARSRSPSAVTGRAITADGTGA